MSNLKVNTINDANGTSNAVLYGVAAPTGSMGFRNRIINGDMRIDQRNAGASVAAPANGAYTVDRWAAFTNGAGVYSVQRSTTAPAGFTNSLLCTVTTIDSSVSGTDYYMLQHKVEGFNSADFAWGSASAASVTLSFWVRSSITGTYSVKLGNSASDRFYIATYTISAANTWEQKTITLVGDTSGTWLTDNSTGIEIRFGMAIGSSFTSSTIGSWAAGSSFGATTASNNWIGTNGATFYITGVQLEPGSVASPFERRDYGRELMMCQRYYYRQTSQAAGDYFVPNAYAISTTQAFGYNTFPVPMRTRPTALEQSGTAADYNVVRCGLGTNANCSSVPTFGVANLTSAQTVFTVSSGLSNGTAGSVQANNTNAYLGWSAEL
jgi:hypothetical protein